MQRGSAKLIVFLSIAGQLLPAIAVAQSETFNPNFLISDAELQNHQSMTLEDIQAFLNLQNGFIARYSAADVNGTTLPVANIIASAATTHRINPKYLLVKLQKEQSLITDQNPTQKQIDWATGYGVCDACSTSDPAIQKHKGFGIQVDSAAGIMRWYYDHLDSEPWIKRVGREYFIDGLQVLPTTLATAFLYTYTPHIQGNKNFWLLWQKWFEQVYPDGTVVKAADEPTVYLIVNGKKRAFANMTALVTRYDPKLIVTAPATELARYETGAGIALANYSILKVNTQYYLLDNETARPFANYEAVRQLGYNPDEIIDATAADISGFAAGTVIATDTKAPLGRVVKIMENNNLYYFDGSALSPITDKQIASINFPHLAVETAALASLGSPSISGPILFKDGTLLAVSGDNKIYVVEKGKKRHISDERVFVGLGYNWKNITWTDAFTGMNHPTGQPLFLREEINIADVSGKIDGDISSPKAAPVYSGDGTPSKAGVMVKTPEAQINFVGEKFETTIDAYAVADAETGALLAGKNVNTLRPMASFTKVMTAHVLFQKGLDVSRSTVYAPKEHKAQYGTFRLSAGEGVKNSDLLRAMLISSINTAAKMLASAVGGGSASSPQVETLVLKSMNEQAWAWGLTKTKFVDVTGEAVDNVTTAREYLTLFRQAAHTTELGKILGESSYRYTETFDVDGKPDHFDDNTNELMRRADQTYKILNSKTGYLDESGGNLAMEIERKKDGKRFVVVMMGAPEYSKRFSEFDKLARWVILDF